MSRAAVAKPCAILRNIENIDAIVLRNFRAKPVRETCAKPGGLSFKLPGNLYGTFRPRYARNFAGAYMEPLRASPENKACSKAFRSQPEITSDCMLCRSRSASTIFDMDMVQRCWANAGTELEQRRRGCHTTRDATQNVLEPEPRSTSTIAGG